MKNLKLLKPRFLVATCFWASAIAPFTLPCQAQDEAPDAPAVAQEGDDAPDTPETPLLAGKGGIGSHEPGPNERFLKKVAGFQLAQNGKALVPIVIADKAGAETRRCAGELREFLNRITGADFAVQTASGKSLDFSTYDGPRKSGAQRAAENKIIVDQDAANLGKPAENLPQNGLVLGTDDEFAAPTDIQSALVIHGGFDGREAYAIRTTPKRIVMLAATDRGTHHAVYRLLHEVGCRWFATGEHWEVIPSTPNLVFDLDLADRPTIAARNVAFMDGAMSDEVVNGKKYSERGAIANWYRRSSLGASIEGGVGHSWHRIAEAYNDELVEHPEYFAEVGGQRQMPVYTDKAGKKHINGVYAKFELGNKRVREMFVEFALNSFRKNPDADMIAMSPTDGGGFSNSEESRKLGDTSDQVYGLINEVARAVNKEFPGKMIGIYAYREIAGPPSFPLEPNVYVEVATLFNLSKYSNAQLLELWPKKAQNLGFYTYFSYFDADSSFIPGGPVSSIKYLKGTIPDFAARNAAVIMAQSSNAWGPHIRGYNVATRLMWNPRADVDAILSDFYEKAYGPAAGVMKRYHERIGRDSGAILTDYLLGSAFRDVDEATKLAKDRPDVLARLGDVKQYLRWIQLAMISHQTPMKTPEDKKLFRANFVNAMQHAAAMRHTYQAQFNMITDRSGRAQAAALKDISYITKNKRGNAKFANIPGDKDAPNTWEGFQEPTPESIEADFQEGLKLLPTRDLPQQELDTSDLVPVVFPSSPGVEALFPADADPKRSEYYQGGSPTYAVYSLAGEPIEVEIQAGVRSKMRPTIWSLRKPDGTLISKGEVAPDMVFVPVSIKVPTRGNYWLNVNAQNQGVRVNYRGDRPMSILWQSSGAGAKDYANPVFYVPKGTREIVYFFNRMNGSGNTFVQPDGKKVTIDDGVNIVPVPPGMDGKVWGTTRSGFRVQRFFNIPNIAAPSISALLVPREIAEKDGLKLRQ